MWRKVLFIGLLALALGVTPTLAQTATTSSATFAWNAAAPPASGAPLSGYRIYWGTAPGVYGTPVDAGNVTQFTVSTLPLQGPIYVAVTAYANAATVNASLYPPQESSFSSEIVGYAATVTMDSNSTITPSGTVWTQSGTTRVFTVTSKAGYDPIVNVDGAMVGVSTGAYTLASVAGNHTISIVSIKRVSMPTGLKFAN